jgi:hypothetical protein
VLIELGKGVGMKLFETSSRATNSAAARGVHAKRAGPPDDFGVDILPAMAAFFSTRALSLP